MTMVGDMFDNSLKTKSNAPYTALAVTTFNREPATTSWMTRKGQTSQTLSPRDSISLRAGRELLAESIKWSGRLPPDCIVILDNEGRDFLTVLLVEVLPENIKARIR